MEEPDQESSASSPFLPDEDDDPEVWLQDYPQLAAKIQDFFATSADSASTQALDIDAQQPDSIPPELRQLGDFRLIRVIGAGGMATVYEAEQISLHRRVAVKVLAPQLRCSERAVQKFLREAEAGGRPNHPGIAAIYAIGKQGTVPFMAQEMVGEGRTLADYLEVQKRQGEPPRGWFRKAARLMAEVAEAVAFAHRSQVIHRDLKPSNILLDVNGKPKVCDFGLARIVGALALSKTGEFSGTPFYMSPEQIRGKPAAVDVHSDIYSLGVTLYELLSWERPFSGDGTEAVFQKILGQEPIPLQKLNRRIPKDLAVICRKAMEKEPQARYGSMAAFAEDLRRFHQGEAILARSPRWWTRAGKWLRRRQALVAAILAVGVAVSATGAWWWQNRQQLRQQSLELRRQFLPLRQAWQWPEFPYGLEGVRWCFVLDPGEPCGPLFQGMVDFGREQFEVAGQQFQRALSLAERRGLDGLQKEIRFLQAAASLAALQSRSGGLIPADHPAKSIIREHGTGAALQEQQVFFWPGSESGEFPSQAFDWIDGLEINQDHTLSHCLIGLRLFEELYKGGTRDEFLAAIQHWKAVQQAWPMQRLAPLLSARCEFFFARTYGLYHLLPELRRRLLELEGRGGEALTFLGYSTLGQIALLMGEADRATIFFQAAEDRMQGERVWGGHNVFRGLGQAHYLLGNREQAAAWFAKAQERQPLDIHLCLALGEFHFTEDLKLTATFAERAWQRSVGKTPARLGQQRQARAGLLLLRVFLAQKRWQDAEALILSLESETIPSPVAIAQAAWILNLFPKRSLLKGQRPTALGAVATRFAAYLSFQQQAFRGLASPYCFSGEGAADLSLGRYPSAWRKLKQAGQIRSRWPQPLQRAQWVDQACELYLQAAAGMGWAAERADSEGLLSEARRAFLRAEGLLQEHGPPTLKSDLLFALREQTQKVLDLPE
ncbi:MAG: serine/threonine protein kinase [Planctomycetota bacterium]|nr:MAG: serine/threonine protein kinase [Planctomycetota bacterium]